MEQISFLYSAAVVLAMRSYKQDSEIQQIDF